MMLLGLLLGIPLLWLVYLIYSALPPDLWTAWPLLLLKASPVLLVAAIAIAIRWIGRSVNAYAPFERRSAGGWLLDRLERERELRINLASLPGDDTVNCYHEKTRSIVLTEAVHHGNGDGHYATATHELGHALMHARAPRMAQLTTWFREKGDLCFDWGWTLLAAVVATGITAALPAAELCFAAAVLAHVVVALDEAIASRIAMRELRGAGLDRRQRRKARVYLLASFTSYAIHAILAGAVLMLWPQLEAWIGAGGFSPGERLSGWLGFLSMIIAAGLLAGAAAALWLTVRPTSEQKSPLRSGLIREAFVLWAPWLFLLLYDQPIAAAAPWAMVLLAVPALQVLCVPLDQGLSIVARLAIKAWTPYASSVIHRRGPPLPAIPLESLAQSEAPKAVFSRVIRIPLVLCAPLAYLYLEQLFNGR